VDEGSSIRLKLINPTGGLTYHWRAHRHADSLWLPFRQLVAAELEAWSPPERELIVLGPSGGYTLPDDFLFRFDRLSLFDPDRCAPFFFHRRHPEVAAEWSRANLVFTEGRFDRARFETELKARPRAAVLFANLLGQLPLLNDDLPAMAAWWRDLQPMLRERSWFSYHDLFSFEGGSGLPNRLSPGEVVPQLVNWSIDRKVKLELIDHGTSDLFKNQAASWVWKFSPRRTHIVGAAHFTIG
jgi:hypothetical protein